MELASARLHKGQIPWWGLLLTASLLTSWSPPTTAQVTIEAVPPDVAEGKDVLLLVHNLPQTLVVFHWYKGNITERDYEIARFIIADNKNVTGAAYSGRETVYSNGSLFFQNVSKSDEGVYTLSVTDEDYAPNVKFYGRFYVHPSLLTSWSPPTTAQVTIEAVPPDVAEGKDVLLLVHNLPQTLVVFHWYKGNITERDYEIARFIIADNKNVTGLAYSGRETVYSNGSLLFQNVKKSDEGVYILDMLNKDFDDIRRSVRLYVHTEKHH